MNEIKNNLKARSMFVNAEITMNIFKKCNYSNGISIEFSDEQIVKHPTSTNAPY